MYNEPLKSVLLLRGVIFAQWIADAPTVQYYIKILNYFYPDVYIIVLY